jgi:hypothetical protein
MVIMKGHAIYLKDYKTGLSIKQGLLTLVLI